MKAFSRSDRVSSLILKHLSLILKKHISDPRLEMATLTGVKVSADLKHARIYFCITGGENKIKQAQEGFESAIGFIRRAIAPELGLRYMPKLTFIYDESFDYGARIERVLSSLNIGHGENHPSVDAE
ncbi:MAG TPA: 30S ribosome-binding factor RbfA [Desulfobacteraceae bacterium]|nr:30S ribosome-binding factor RbfA [Desulfobacteraceae bacterium]